MVTMVPIVFYVFSYCALLVVLFVFCGMLPDVLNKLINTNEV